jgi:hypothetical protein
MMTIDEFMIALEQAWGHALPGHEAADRDELLRGLRRLIEAREVERTPAPIRLRVMIGR